MTSVIMVATLASTFAFANATTESVSVVNEEKDLLIEQCASEIICIEIVTDQEYEEINIEEEDEIIENGIEELSVSTYDEIEKMIHDSLIELSENENCYFSEEGVELIEAYCPEIIENVQTEKDLTELCEDNKDSTLSSLLKSMILDEAYAVSTPDRTWKKSSNYSYSSVLGKLIKENHQMKWVVKNSKITSASTSMSKDYNKKYIKFGTYTTVTKKITNNGQRARIQTKVKYTYIPTGKAISHKVGAWMYNDGGCDFD